LNHGVPVLFALSVLLLSQKSFAQDGDFGTRHNFGLGVMIGEPTGISAKLWTSNGNAFDFGLGWSMSGNQFGSNNGYYNGGSRIHFHMDYLWHSFDTIHSTERLPLYYGFGGRINSGAGHASSLAIRGVLGIAWLPRGFPIDVFLEVAPSLQLTSSTGFGVDGGIGARYFF
jgi:hypothetical protein